jgi:hypothetical protein
MDMAISLSVSAAFSWLREISFVAAEKLVAREYSQPIRSHHDMQTKLDSWTKEGGSYLIQEDVTAVHQYFDIHRSRNRLPEKRLMLAVLQDALFCFQRYFRARSSRRRKLFFESWQWFNNEEGSESVFAFENICEVLGLDASYIRRGLKLCEGLSGPFGRYKSAHLRIKSLNSSVEMNPTKKFEDAGNISAVTMFT